MGRPRCLDLFCGAGGAGMGYHRAGYEVVGVDIKPQPNYPFEFVQADAMEFPLGGFDLVHASPPCQRYSVTTHGGVGTWEDHPDLFGLVIARLRGNPSNYVVENVQGAPFEHGIRLCGTMFGLPIWRHRIFETRPMLLAPSCQHGLCPEPLNPYRSQSRKRNGITGTTDPKFRDAMGVDWMKGQEISESIPPAYTEWIGRQIMDVDILPVQVRRLDQSIRSPSEPARLERR